MRAIWAFAAAACASRAPTATATPTPTATPTATATPTPTATATATATAIHLPHADGPTIADGDALEAQLFLDPSAEGCQALVDAVEALGRELPGRVRVAWRFAPSDDGSEELAGWAIVQAEANREKGAAALWSMHRLLCRHRDALDKAALLAYAQGEGLDAAKVRAALGDHRFDGAFARDAAVMAAAGVPRATMVIDGTVVDAAHAAGAVALARERLGVRVRPAP